MEIPFFFIYIFMNVNSPFYLSTSFVHFYRLVSSAKFKFEKSKVLVRQDEKCPMVFRESWERAMRD